MLFVPEFFRLDGEFPSLCIFRSRNVGGLLSPIHQALIVPSFTKRLRGFCPRRLREEHRVIGREHSLEWGLPEHEGVQAAPGEPVEMPITGPCPESGIQQPWGQPKPASVTLSLVVQGETLLLDSVCVQMHGLGELCVTPEPPSGNTTTML